MATQTKDYGKALRDAREAHHESIEDVGVDAKRALDRRRGVSSENLRRMETGVIPEAKADEWFVVYLCDRWNLDIEEVSPIIAAKLRGQRDVLVRLLRWIDDLARQGHLARAS